jgi:hypothetical protein
MKFCEWPSLDRPLGRSRNDHLQGIEWLGPGEDTISKINHFVFRGVWQRVAMDSLKYY